MHCATALVGYKIARNTYTCFTCVASRETASKYRDAVEKIAEMMRVDEDAMRTDQTEPGGSSQRTVDEVEEECDTEVTDVLTITEETPSGNASSQISEGENAQRVEAETEPRREVQKRTVQICRNYLMKKCQYGKSGRVGGNCRHEHSKICRKYLNFGTNANGYRLGVNCQFYHPKICWQFSKNRQCKRENCSFYHNTQQVQPRRRNANEPMSETGRPRRADPRIIRNTQDNSRNQRPMHFAAQSGQGESEPQNNDSSRNFLSIQGQLQAQTNQMQQILQLLMLKEKNAGHQRLTTCRCGQASC